MVSEALSAMLHNGGYEVSVTGPGTLADFDREDADTVLLDVRMPGVTVADVYKRLKSGSRVPIIMIGDPDGDLDTMVAQDVDADDATDLTGRIRRMLNLQLTDADDASASVLEGGPVRMDMDRFAATVNGVPVQLPLKEFQLLEVLLRNAGRVLTRGRLIAEVWGADYVGDTKTLDVHVKRLRSKIEPTPSKPRHIVNVRSIGFKFDP